MKILKNEYSDQMVVFLCNARANGRQCGAVGRRPGHDRKARPVHGGVDLLVADTSRRHRVQRRRTGEG